mgnify:FL=1
MIYMLKQEKDVEKAYRNAERQYNQYLIVGKTEEANAVFDQFEARYGVRPIPSTAGKDAAIKRYLTPSLSRQEEGMPEPLQWPNAVLKGLRQGE